MDDQASAAWKNVAMQALDADEAGDDDGLVGVDWLAASINSREIPDFTAADFLEPLGEGEEALVEHSAHLHAIEEAQRHQSVLRLQQQERPVMRQSFSMNDLQSLHLQPANPYQSSMLVNPYAAKPSIQLPSVPEEPSRPSANAGHYNSISSHPPTMPMVPSFDLMGSGVMGYGPSGFMPSSNYGFPLPPPGQRQGMVPLSMYATMPHVDLAMEDQRHEAGGDTNSSVGPSDGRGMPSLKRGLLSGISAGQQGTMRRTQSALELGAWEKMAAGDMEYVDPSGTLREQLQGMEMNQIGKLTPAERLQKILRYRAKRQMRNFSRTIKYQCRKSLADTRPRVRGRFARDNEPGSVLPHETKKATAGAGGREVPGVLVKQEPVLALGSGPQNEIMAMFDQWSEAGTERTTQQEATMPGNASNSA